MPDREKVIKGLEETEIMLKQAVDRGREMAVLVAFKCLNRVTDALALLKEQEAVEPTSYMDGLVQRFTCGKCGKHLLYAKWGRDNFCSKCGQAVKWE